MTAERDPMILNEIPYSSLLVEERSDEALRDGRAGATPDPEVVANPKRRQFSAEYRLRTLEQADRCTQPGEEGRLLRREGLYTSHLATWRRHGERARCGRWPRRIGRETGRTQPVRCESGNARSESGAPGRRVAHRAHDPGRAGKISGLLGLNLEHETLS